KTLAKKRTRKPHGKAKSPCPLCSSVLYGDETVISRVYKTSSKTDQPCTIHGCPHCFPEPENGIKRLCPVCHKKVPPKGHLNAYLFPRENNKKHIHITGCSECHKR
ncbi:MAG: hypothetical protein R3Y36_06620, partial [Spirochaetales bacterium]